MIKKESRNALRQKRHLRSRQRLVGTKDRPRLSVFRSNKALYVQLIDDEKGNTLLSVSTKELNLAGANVENAKKLGEAVANKALEANIKEVVFDRGGYKYHGKIKALADAVRANGLKC